MEKSQKSRFFVKLLSLYALGGTASASRNDTNSVVSVIDGNGFPPSAISEAGRRLVFGLPLGVDSLEFRHCSNKFIRSNDSVVTLTARTFDCELDRFFGLVLSQNFSSLPRDNEYLNQNGSHYTNN